MDTTLGTVLCRAVLFKQSKVKEKNRLKQSANELNGQKLNDCGEVEVKVKCPTSSQLLSALRYFMSSVLRIPAENLSCPGSLFHSMYFNLATQVVTKQQQQQPSKNEEEHNQMASRHLKKVFHMLLPIKEMHIKNDAWGPGR